MDTKMPSVSSVTGLALCGFSSNAADLLGRADQSGALDVGKWADITQLDSITFVMKAGTVYKNGLSH